MRKLRQDILVIFGCASLSLILFTPDSVIEFIYWGIPFSFGGLIGSRLADKMIGDDE